MLAQAVPGKEIHVANAHNYPFCEIGLITGKPPSELIANIYNTTGASDCPPAKFDPILADDGEKLAKETGSLKVWLNPRRHRMFDEVWVYEVCGARDFDGVKASWMAKLSPEGLMKATVEEHYVGSRIFRKDKMLWEKGSTVYLLDAPDGKTVYVMQSWTDHWNKSETLENLKDLGSTLTLPQGWKFRMKTLDRDLTIEPPPPDHLALVAQDNFHNTYEACGTDAACNYTP